MTMLPNGRVAKPTPNVASDSSRLPSGVWDGKKDWPICVAKKVYVMKS